MSGLPATGADGLRRRWAAASAVAGWRFPSDWDVPAVAALCEACVTDGAVWAAAERLGRARATAGVSLEQTLTDLDTLAELVPASLAGTAVRAATLGWSGHPAADETPLVDGLTGLVTPPYLVQRLAEVYQAAEAAGRSVADGSALVVVELLPAGAAAWRYVAPMILVSDALRCVFAAGETLARLGVRVAAVLGDRHPMLPRRARLAASLVAAGLDGDPDLAVEPPRVWIERLPDRHPAAVELVDELGR